MDLGNKSVDELDRLLVKTVKSVVKWIGVCLMDFSSKIAINKGWSDDKKYCVTVQNQ